jgi:hypothetical protein
MGGRWKTMACAAGLLASFACAIVQPTPSTAAQPSNDDFADAKVVTGFPASATGTTAGATSEAGEPDYGESGGESIWFTWQAPSSGPVTIDTCDTFFFEDVLAVFTGGSLAGLKRVAGYEAH